MKKVISLIAMLAFVFNVAIAQEGSKQTATKKTEKEQKAEKEKSEVKVRRTEDPNNSANYIELPENTKESKKEAAGPTKKDGTPDKRYKENKEPKGPKKKDGTPDKRYKENKTEKKK